MPKPGEYEKIPYRENHITLKKFKDFCSGRIHWHETIEILYYHDDRAKVICNLNEVKVKAGDIVFVNGNELHRATTKGEYATYHVFHVRTDFLSNHIGDKHIIFKNHIRDEDCAKELDTIIKYENSDDIDKEIKKKKHMCAFFELLVERHIYSIMDEDEYKKHFKVYDKFNEMVLYINAHYDEELTLKSLADEFFMSESYFSFLFKKNAGKSVMKYVNELRIQHAKTYLDREDIPISQIANKVGFDDINYFSRKFKGFTGMTPSEYKKRNNG